MRHFDGWKKGVLERLQTTEENQYKLFDLLQINAAYNQLNFLNKLYSGEILDPSRKELLQSVIKIRQRAFDKLIIDLYVLHADDQDLLDHFQRSSKIFSDY